jgi:hypothetical protein
MMAKLILEFDPFEEQREATHAVNGLKYYCALSDRLGQSCLRNKLKYGSLTHGRSQHIHRRGVTRQSIF